MKDINKLDLLIFSIEKDMKDLNIKKSDLYHILNRNTVTNIFNDHTGSLDSLHKILDFINIKRRETMTNINKNVFFKCPTCGAIIETDENRKPLLETCKICQTAKDQFIMLPLKKIEFLNFDTKYSIVFAQQVDNPNNKVYLVYINSLNPRFSNFKIIRRMGDFIFPADYHLLETFFKTTDDYKMNPYPIHYAR